RGVPAELLGATHVRREGVDRAGVEAVQSEARERGHPAGGSVAGLRHARHVDPGVVAILAERVDPLPEIRQRGQAGLVHPGALAPDAPRFGMEAARLLDPPLTLRRLAPANQQL